MKPEQSERLLVEELLKKSISKLDFKSSEITSVDKLTGDASTRRYYRVFIGQESFVVCLDEPTKVPGAEPNFLKLQRVLKEQGVRVPGIIDRELGAGYILEEDLGDRTFLRELSKIESSDAEFEFYKKAVDGMIHIHQVDVEKYAGEPFTVLAFDLEKLYFEMEFSKKYFLGKFLGVDLESIEVKILYSKLSSICETLAKEERVLVHRDYHSRNIMLKDDEQVIIDFQDARMGTPLYDLVSLLEDCYYLLEEANREKLKTYYYETFFKKRIKQNSRQHFDYIYDLMAIQRIYKAIGSFSYIFADRSDVRYVKYIGFAFERLRLILSRHKEFDEARKILCGIYYAN